MPAVHLATFYADVTVPLGHPLCGGWIKPAEKIAGLLSCHGLVILGDEAPVVLCAIDWTGLCNLAHVRFRESLAKATHTTPERIVIHCVHQHNAPFIDPEANDLVRKHKDLSSIYDDKWFDDCMKRVAAAAQDACGKTQRATHVKWAGRTVDQVASNRRIMGPDGKIKAWRASKCTDAALRAEPEGLIDPWLKTISFWNDKRKLAALHYYATHPMSYYGDGLVNPDFVGLARNRRTEEDGLAHLYFTGCAGNVAAGKYNDGSPAARTLLADRIHRAMVESEQKMYEAPLDRLRWSARTVHPPPRKDIRDEDLAATLAYAKATPSVRTRAAMQLAYRQRIQNRVGIELALLQFNQDPAILHLPAECFVEYQLFAAQQRPRGFVAVAAYGDGGPWYIPTANAYDEGGYEPSNSYVAPTTEKLLQDSIVALLKG